MCALIDVTESLQAVRANDEAIGFASSREGARRFDAGRHRDYVRVEQTSMSKPAPNDLVSVK